VAPSIHGSKALGSVKSGGILGQLTNYSILIHSCWYFVSHNSSVIWSVSPNTQMFQNCILALL